MNEPMTDQEIREIEALAEKATAGPWEIPYHCTVFNNERPIATVYDTNDQKFVVASRAAVPRMAGEIRRLTRENSDLRAALDLERKGDPLSAEVERLREALKWMRFAYINKDADMPHQFEIEALQKAEKLIRPCDENGGSHE